MRLDVPAGTSVRFEPGIETRGRAGAVRRPARRRRPARPGRRTARCGRRTARCSPDRDARYAGAVRADRPATASAWPTPTCGSRSPRTAAPAATRRCSAAARSSASRWASRRRRGPTGTPDLVITGAVVLDHWGVIKADVGVRDGRIVGIGKAGNPDTMDGVDPALVIGPSTEIMSGNGTHPHRRRDRLPRPPDLPADRSTRRSAPASPRSSAAAPARPRAPRRPRSRRAPGTWPGCSQALDDWPLNVALLGQGQHGVARGAAGAAARRRRRLQAARGLGHDAGRDRRLPDAWPTSPASRWRSTPTR